ncbi:methyltransferase domain-containing protein [Halomonas sp. ZH2S]|uniref:Methyltransferase domain-containing protein n=1 Tax=Vreelandella zhuhanensis TaxID=2684210 RepID=A0A7X3KQN4_9GAMM|nr:methyltransferase domain-containing protein [Halomonas zhuhanensis]MWJ28680.1 methyltransferase domain-containing protein [Halomonas zhuhanensis]
MKAVSFTTGARTMLMSLTHRQLEGELMDDPALDRKAHQAALNGLRRINAASRTAAALWPRIARIAKARRLSSLSVLDVATGGGDVAIALARRARDAGLRLRIEACDISPTALHFAQGQAVREKVEVSFFPLDVLEDPLLARYDIITSTLFLHHLSDAQIAALLEKLAAQTDHLLVSDLIRNHTGYGLAYVGTRLLSASKIVHVDAMRSVRAALTVAEARRLASQAGLQGVRFERHWPSRFMLSWSRNQGVAPMTHQGALP